MNNLPFFVVGNSTSDPELRYTDKGIAICRVSVAHNPRFFDRTADEWRNGEPTFITCVFWRDLAEHVGQSIPKGARLMAYGNLKTRRWESDGSGKTPAGQKIERLELDVIAAGPELTYATAKIEKAQRRGNGETAPDDPWSTASRERPATGAASTFDEEPPW